MSGRSRAAWAPSVGEQDAEAVGERLADGEDDLEDGDDDGEEDERAGDAMQQDGVEAAGPQGGRGRLVFGARGDLRGPVAAGGGGLQDGKLDGARAVVGAAAGAGEEVGDDVEALAVGGADEGDGMAELLGEGEGVDACRRAPPSGRPC